MALLDFWGSKFSLAAESIASSSPIVLDVGSRRWTVRGLQAGGGTQMTRCRSSWASGYVVTDRPLLFQLGSEKIIMALRCSISIGIYD
jgi:hypothetical protein